MEGIPMDRKTSEVIESIRQVADQTGTWGKWKQLCEELNKRGIKTSRGKEWGPTSLRQICNAYRLFEDASAQEPDEAKTQQYIDTTPVMPAETPEQEPIPQSTTGAPQAERSALEVAQLDADTVAALKEVVVWWKSKGAEMAMRNVTWENEPASPAYRPSFPGKRKNTGIRINEKLLKDALERAKTSTESVKTGGGISPLIEYLLWGYLGFDQRYLKG